MTRIILAVLIVSAAVFGCGQKKETTQTVEQEIDIVSEYGKVEEALTQVSVEEQIDEMPQAKQDFVKPALKDIQQALKNAGFDVVVDGKEGPKTKQAIKDFQAKNGLKADGKVGPQTWKKLQPYLDPARQ